jgi:soluble lytic murein transglycosylase-like protein
MITRIFILSFLLLIITAASAHSDIYKYVDEDGVAYYTNVPKDRRYKKIFGEKGSVSFNGPYHEIIESKASRYGVEPSLVAAVISVESNWKPDAVSSRGAIGLMQLMPGTAEDMQVLDPFDPEENIEGGVRYLRFLLDRFKEVDLALAAYNAGPRRVEEYGGIPAISETRQYVKKVLSIYKGDGLSYSGTDYGSGQTQILRVSMRNGPAVYR